MFYFYFFITVMTLLKAAYNVLHVLKCVFYGFKKGDQYIYPNM